MKARKPKVVPIRAGTVMGRCPSAPDWLCADARLKWSKTAPILHQRGLLGPDTSPTLEYYCTAVTQVRQFEALMGAEGRIIQTEHGMRDHPAYRLQHVAIAAARLLACELGISPHRRGKHEESQPDAWDGLLG